MLVCNRCFKQMPCEIYDRKFRHQIDMRTCPIGDCGGFMIPIDDQIVGPVIELWRRGLSTYWSCAGHPGKTTYSSAGPYLVISAKLQDCVFGAKLEEEYAPIEVQRYDFSFQKLSMTKFNQLVLQPLILPDDGLRIGLNHADVMPWPNMCINEQLRLQTMFITFIYRIISLWDWLKHDSVQQV